ncbi:MULTISPECIES: DMT family transporter [Rhizobium]|uniref:DMT family transporter n=1 Tax=Rhizobium TaxID=379 RepID=UPI00103A8D5B|nr:MULTISPECIES: DMT family transporter [Rhizobium]MBB3522225.1 drug/metabolite transporter (DMT)-like permease [Rhizobium sp. BK456]MBY4587660.1 DMT family transporter [Rhizobium redzepovicii]MBY4617298.1 DMT family transporter [Rhizobium redzepovicii]MDF0659043.1 DMT family transporter [Rhizobium sp. BC49]TBY44678.1 DMT family transporter [Rhizobium leguminosarum bv. viciae]
MSLDRLAPALFVLLWSTGWVVAKYAALHSEPFTFLSIRYGLSALAFLALCVVMRAQWPTSRTTWLRAIYSGFFLHGFYLAGLWWAIANGVPAGISGIIAALQPLLTAMAAPFLVGERLQQKQKLGLAFGFIGIAIAISPKLVDPATSDLTHAALPLAINLIAMGSVTYGTLYQKKHLQSGDLRTIATLQYVGALILTLPLSLIFEHQHFDGAARAYAALAWSVFGLSMGGVGLLLYLIRRGQVSRAASLIYLMPPAVALEAFIAFGEPLTLPLIVGTAIVVTGVYMTNRRVVQQVPASV